MDNIIKLRATKKLNKLVAEELKIKEDPKEARELIDEYEIHTRTKDTDNTEHK